MFALAAGLTLVWIIVEDLRNYRIRNAAVLILTLCFVGQCMFYEAYIKLFLHAVLAAIGFGCLLGPFALRMIGGGDVKLLTSALLWAGPEGVLPYASLLLILTLLYALGAWLGWVPTRRVGPKTVIAFGPSIAGALVLFIVLGPRPFGGGGAGTAAGLL